MAMRSTATDGLLANLLGALGVAVGDAQDDAMVTGRRAADVAALLTLHQFRGTNIGQLAAVLGLSHSAAVRVADRLCAQGLCTRGVAAAGDARRVAITLTTAGRKEATRLGDVRRQALEAMVGPLDLAERDELARLVDRVLRSQPRGREAARHTCRYCDHGVCTGPVCPVGCSVSRSRGNDTEASR